MFVRTAAVIGAGTMGAEIAYAIADAELPVILHDVDHRRVESGLNRARSLWQARVEDGRLDAAALERRLEMITGASDLAPLGDADLVIEAVPEELEIKQAVFAELDAATPSHAILATNTSALSITAIGEVTERPDKVVGLHFFYPAATSRLVEVIESDYTSPETARDAAAFAQSIRRSAIRCGEAPGFVVNRILNAAVSELWRAQAELGVSPEEIDAMVVESKAAPIGPFRLTDLLGLDIVLHVAEHLRECYGERFYVSEQLRELVAAGHLGVKSGRGFYDHGG
jgi:3-hydroxyacyl-CoA dehydrogenase